MSDRNVTPQLQIRVQRVEAGPIIFLTGELDLDTVGALASALDDLDGRLLVDLDGVSFLDSSGIRTLVSARKRLLGSGGDLRLRAPRAHVRRVLEITGLDGILVGVQPESPETRDRRFPPRNPE